MPKSSTSSLLLDVKNVTRILTGVVQTTLLRDINLSVKSGEFVTITGPSGGGKSSLLYLLGLLDRPTDGEIFIQGQATGVCTATELADIRLEKIGFVFQFHFLLEEFTALENVMLPMNQLNKHTVAERQQRAEQLLTTFNLAEHLHKRPDQLSGGQRQRIAIARAMANAPALILADEPTGNLDTKNADIVFQAFRRIVDDTGASVIVVTHDMELAKRADRQIHLVDGEIVS